MKNGKVWLKKAKIQAQNTLEILKEFTKVIKEYLAMCS
jgi:hypothetical protein